MNEKLRIAIYTRVSTEDQAKEGYSLEVQREYLESFATCESYEIFKVYCDDGISAYSTRRPALQALLADAKVKRFELVVVSFMSKMYSVFRRKAFLEIRF